MQSLLVRICLVIAVLALAYFSSPWSFGWLGGPVLTGLESIKNNISQVWCGGPEFGRLERKVRSLENKNAALLFALQTQRPLRPLTSARVIAYSPLDSWQAIALDAGKKDGIKVGDIAVDHKGQLIGRVIRASSRTSEVLLVTNPTQVIDTRIGELGYRAVVSGRFHALEARRGLWLAHGEYIDRHSPVKKGDIATTSGLDGIYPAGIPFGRVHLLSRDQLNLFQEAIIIPLVDFTLLKEVYLLAQSL